MGTWTVLLQDVYRAVSAGVASEVYVTLLWAAQLYILQLPRRTCPRRATRGCVVGHLATGTCTGPPLSAQMRMYSSCRAGVVSVGGVVLSPAVPCISNSARLQK